MSRDPRIDAYIEKSEEFARPVLRHLRELIHKACPEIHEAVKWGCPHFDYKGPVCHMASFKKHCAFGFWKAALMKDAEILMATARSEVAMGHMGKIASLKDLPSDKVLMAYVKEAVKLNENGIKLVAKKASPAERAELETPEYLLKALKTNKAARGVFESFSYSNKKEYIEWLEEAKTEATRSKRLETALEWITEGKSRNWKYKKQAGSTKNRFT